MVPVQLRSHFNLPQGLREAPTLTVPGRGGRAALWSGKQNEKGQDSGGEGGASPSRTLSLDELTAVELASPGPEAQSTCPRPLSSQPGWGGWPDNELPEVLPLLQPRWKPAFLAGCQFQNTHPGVNVIGDRFPERVPQSWSKCTPGFVLQRAWGERISSVANVVKRPWLKSNLAKEEPAQG